MVSGLLLVSVSLRSKPGPSREGTGGMNTPTLCSSVPLLGCIHQGGQEDQVMPSMEVSTSGNRQGESGRKWIWGDMETIASVTCPLPHLGTISSSFRWKNLHTQHKGTHFPSTTVSLWNAVSLIILPPRSRMIILSTFRALSCKVAETEGTGED